MMPGRTMSRCISGKRRMLGELETVLDRNVNAARLDLIQNPLEFLKLAVGVSGIGFIGCGEVRKHAFQYQPVHAKRSWQSLPPPHPA